LAYSYVYVKNRKGEIVPEVVGFSIDKIIGKEVDNADVKTYFLKNMHEKAVIQKWEELSNIKSQGAS